MTEKFDAVIIGTGQAGPSMAQRMTGAGMKTAIIERKLFGGTCVNVGCIPTKALVASARAAYMAGRGGDFGVVIEGTNQRRYEAGQGAQGRHCQAIQRRRHELDEVDG